MEASGAGEGADAASLAGSVGAVIEGTGADGPVGGAAILGSEGVARGDVPGAGTGADNDEVGGRAGAARGAPFPFPSSFPIPSPSPSPSPFFLPSSGARVAMPASALVGDVRPVLLLPKPPARPGGKRIPQETDADAGVDVGASSDAGEGAGCLCS
jgi:hypothetical protein